MLMKRDVALKEQVMVAIYGDRIDDPPQAKIIDVLVCRMRPKLSPFDRD